MTLSSGNRSKIEGIKEIMYCDFIVNKNTFLLMDEEQIINLLNQKLINEGSRAFVLKKDFYLFNIKQKRKIECSLKYILDKSGIKKLGKDKLWLQFFEELEYSTVDIELEPNIKHLEIIIYENGYLEDIKDCAYEEPDLFHTFTEDKIFFKTKKNLERYSINSESYGKKIKSYLLVQSDVGGSSLDLISENLSSYILEFKYL